MNFITRLLQSILPFLFNALERAWNNLNPVQQQAIVNSGMIGQLLKNNLSVLGDDLVRFIANKTGLTTDEVSNTLIALAKTFGLTTSDVNAAVAFLQSELSGAASNEEWNGILSIILNAGATILSGGALDWVHIALGLGQWAYQQFVQPKTGLVLNSVSPIDVVTHDLSVNTGHLIGNTAGVPVVTPIGSTS